MELGKLTRVINSKALSAKDLLKLPAPIILTAERLDFEKIFIDSGYMRVGLNLPLSRILNGLPANESRMQITERVQEILSQTKYVYLVDFEMLFDPRYELDVLRLFVNLARSTKLVVKWCGGLSNGELTYAEQGYSDFKKYKINDYDVVVVA